MDPLTALLISIAVGLGISALNYIFSYDWEAEAKKAKRKQLLQEILKAAKVHGEDVTPMAPFPQSPQAIPQRAPEAQVVPPGRRPTMAPVRQILADPYEGIVPGRLQDEVANQIAYALYAPYLEPLYRTPPNQEELNHGYPTRPGTRQSYPQ